MIMVIFFLITVQRAMIYSQSHEVPVFPSPIVQCVCMRVIYNADHACSANGLRICLGKRGVFALCGFL